MHGFEKAQSFRGSYHLHLQGKKVSQIKKTKREQLCSNASGFFRLHSVTIHKSVFLKPN
jgi:hypothetical protein